MTQAIAKTYNMAHEYRKHISIFLIAGCLAMILAYGINVYMLITRTVAVQKITGQVVALDQQVHKLDAQYLGLSSTITPDTIQHYGMTEGHVTEYISRTTALGSAVGNSIARAHEL